MSLAIVESSTLESIILLRPIDGRTTSANITTPIPPIHVDDMRQNCNPRGRASTSFRIVDPVVVRPETLSNQALTSENSPPHIR